MPGRDTVSELFTNGVWFRTAINQVVQFLDQPGRWFRQLRWRDIEFKIRFPPVTFPTFEHRRWHNDIAAVRTRVHAFGESSGRVMPISPRRLAIYIVSPSAGGDRERPRGK